MKALDTYLVNQDAGLIQLLTPPFNGNGPNPGYIQGYVPGVRENGGQYTHGAIWAIMAFAHSGNRAHAWAYRLIVETLLGVARHGDVLTIATELPHDWPSASLSYRYGNSRYDITLRNSSGEYRLTLDGTELPQGKIPLIDDGQSHQVEIALGNSAAG